MKGYYLNLAFSSLYKSLQILVSTLLLPRATRRLQEVSTKASALLFHNICFVNLFIRITHLQNKSNHCDIIKTPAFHLRDNQKGKENRNNLKNGNEEKSS